MLQYEMAIRLGAFSLVFGAMAAWELYAPLRQPALPRKRRWRTNLGLAAINAGVLRLVLPTTAIAVAMYAQSQGLGLLNQTAWPQVLQVVLAVLLLDLAIYFQHVLFHAVPALSRLHQVHHADPGFDVSTGIRFHPLEMLLSHGIKLLVIVSLGAPALAVLVFEVLLNASSLFNHGNVSLPRGAERALRALVVTPDMHRVHHSAVEQERNSNYGFFLSVWDHALGTYRADSAQGQLSMCLGLNTWPDPAVSTSLRGALGMPFAAPVAALDAER